MSCKKACKKAYNKTIMMVIAYWILELSWGLVLNFKMEFTQIVKTDIENEYLYIIFSNISDLLTIFPILIYLIWKKIMTKKEKEKEKEDKVKINDENTLLMSMSINDVAQSDDSTNHYKKMTNADICKKIFIFAGLSLAELLARSRYFIYFSSIKTVDNHKVSMKLTNDILLFFDIIMRFFFYKCFFKQPFKRHYIFSMAVISFIFSLLTIFDVVYLNITDKNMLNRTPIYIAFLFSRSILFPLVDTIYKKLMDERYIFPLFYILIRSIYHLIYLLILTPIFLSASILHFTLDIFTSKFWKISAFYISVNFIKHSLLINIIYDYSSTFVSFLIMSEPLSNSIYEIINFIIEKEKSWLAIFKAVVEIIFFILIILSTLVFEETIVIPICGLNIDVQAEIERRSRYESQMNEEII